MIVDAQLQFSDAQAITAAADSTNYIDLSVARDVAVGRPLYVYVTVDVAMTDSGSDSTIAVLLEFDSTTTFTPDASQALFTIPATSAAGSRFCAAISPSLVANTKYQYMQLSYTPANGNLTTGSFTANIVLDPQEWHAYADNITIS
jgi:hypothetical protein